MEEETIDLRKYWLLLKRWVWLLFLGLVLGAATGFGISEVQTPVYQAVTKVMVTRGGMADQSLDIYSTIYTNELTQTYLQLLQTQTVLASTSDRLGIDLEDAAIDAKAIQDTNIIEISVEHTRPKLAASIANTLVDVLIEKNNEIQSGRYTLMEESLTTQKTQLESQIASLQNQISQASIKTIDEQEQWLQDQITTLEQEAVTLPTEISALGNPTTPELRNSLDQKKARLEQVQLQLPLYKQSYTDLVVYGKQVDPAKSTANSQLALLTTTQTLYQQLYQSVLSNLETVRLAGMENTPSIVSIEAATVPETPVKPKKLINTALAGMVGLMLTTGILVLKESLDNSIKTSDNIERLLGVNPIGYILEIKNSGKGEEGLYASKQPRSQIAEAFRSLRTNIEFSSVDKPIKTILVTSPEPATGKTMVAANLAVVFSQKGKRVLLLDADLRRPQVHRVMNLQNRVGLTDLLLENQNIQDVIHHIDGNESLSVVTSGSLPPNPAELLGSARMVRLLTELGENMDIMILDSPPSIVADAQVLAAKVDAVLIVIRPGKTQRDSVKATIEILKRANARIIGLVINRISRDRGDYNSRYHSQDYEYNSPDEYKIENANSLSGKNNQNKRKPLFRRSKKEEGI
jgi:polysaccharide biosynthesis transport protein